MCVPSALRNFGRGFRILTAVELAGLEGRLGFEVVTTVKLSMLVFWVVTPCGRVGLNHCKESFILMVILVNSILTRTEYVPFIDLHNTLTAGGCRSEVICYCQIEMKPPKYTVSQKMLTLIWNFSEYLIAK
jgi:hypothetical protein